MKFAKKIRKTIFFERDRSDKLANTEWSVIEHGDVVDVDGVNAVKRATMRRP